MHGELDLGERNPAYRATALRTTTFDSRTLIRMDSDYEVRAWCDQLGCSYQQLRGAISAVGPSVDRVCAHLSGL